MCELLTRARKERDYVAQPRKVLTREGEKAIVLRLKLS